MKPKMIVKICVDIGMTVALLFLMTYELIGQAFHEWLGIGIFVLFVVHHILNRKWFGTLLKGKYTPVRIWQIVLVVLVLLSMVGSMVSGIILSRSALSFLPIRGGSSFGRKLHMLSAYWGFTVMSLHLGFHWNMMIEMIGKTGKIGKRDSAARTWTARGLALVIAAYGIYAFIRRNIGSYMLLTIHFVFFDYEEPLIFFLADYMAVMGLFVCIGHYLTVFMRLRSKSN